MKFFNLFTAFYTYGSCIKFLKCYVNYKEFKMKKRAEGDDSEHLRLFLMYDRNASLLSTFISKLGRLREAEWLA